MDKIRYEIKTVTEIYKPAIPAHIVKVTEIEHFAYLFLMPMKAAKPKKVSGIHLPTFQGFCNKDKTEISKSIYNTGRLKYKIYGVNLEEKMSWNKYLEELKKIQPDIQILDVEIKSFKRVLS